MTLTASEGDSGSTAGQVVLIVLIIGGIIYAFGYARAVMHRANKDYKTTKAAVPVLRKGFWSAWFAVVKVGFWVTIAVAVLFVWMIRGTDKDADAVITPSHTPSVTRSHR